MFAAPTHLAARPYGFPKVSHFGTCILHAGCRVVTHDARTNVSPNVSSPSEQSQGVRQRHRAERKIYDKGARMARFSCSPRVLY